MTAARKLDETIDPMTRIADALELAVIVLRESGEVDEAKEIAL